MKLFQKLGVVVATVMAAVLFTGAAFAEIGVVDIQKIMSSYSKSQTITQEAQSKEQQLQQLRANLANELKNKGEALSPVEKKNLEDKLNQQFMAKFKEFRQWVVQQDKMISDEVEKAVNSVAQQQGVTMVLNKGVVIQGGKDLTQDVISKLNTGN